MIAMEHEAYWRKQEAGTPLFPDLLWSRPENRALAGKLLIIGGNTYGFAAPAEAYQEATKAGVGIVQILLPDSLRHTVGKVLEAGDFAPVTPSGSVSQRAAPEFLTHAAWADGVLLAGDLGRNSETAILLEKFIESYRGPLTVTKDAADYFTAAPSRLLARGNTTLVISFAQLQRLASAARFPQPFLFELGILQIVERLHQFTLDHPVNFVVKHLSNIFVAINGEVSSTRLTADQELWRVRSSAHASVWWLQNPAKPFEALTSAIFEVTKLSA
jgi:hypothetical protein